MGLSLIDYRQSIPKQHSPKPGIRRASDPSVTKGTLSTKGEVVDRYTKAPDEHFHCSLNDRGRTMLEMFRTQPLVAFTVDQLAYGAGCRRGIVMSQLWYLLGGHVVERIGDEVYRLRLPEHGVDDLSDEAKELRAWYERNAQPALLLSPASGLELFPNPISSSCLNFRCIHVLSITPIRHVCTYLGASTTNCHFLRSVQLLVSSEKGVRTASGQHSVCVRWGALSFSMFAVPMVFRQREELLNADGLQNSSV